MSNAEKESMVKYQIILIALQEIDASVTIEDIIDFRASR